MPLTALTVKSSQGSYAVERPASLGEVLSAARERGAGAHVLVDEVVPRLFPAALAGLDPARTTSVAAHEDQKSLAALEPIFQRIIGAGLRRDGLLLVAGGGVVQDIGCFVASVLYRGIAWEFVPTTLLAQCDSCIGSKSSINVGPLKNQLGTFYPPRRVHLMFDFLKTLPRDEIRSGLGEVVKLHILEGGETFAGLAARLGGLSERLDDLPPLVLRSLEIKKRYIEEDELDKGIRNLLNYGHTFGHAYESATSYAIPHGIAVVLGIVSATFVSERIGLAPAGHFGEIDALLRPYYVPYQEALARAPVDAILAAMRTDKKSTGAASNFILTRGPGRMEKVPLALDERVRPLLEALLPALCGPRAAAAAAP